MADNRPPKPFGRPYSPGETYIDTVTGESKQVQASGPDRVMRVSRSAPKAKETTAAKTTSSKKASTPKSLKDLSKRLSEAKIAFEPFDPIKRPSALEEPATVLFEGRQYNKKELSNIISVLQDQVDSISSAASDLKSKSDAIREEVALDEETEKRGFEPSFTPSQRSKKLQEAAKLETQAKKIETTGSVPKTQTTGKPATSGAAKTVGQRPTRVSGPTAAEIRAAKAPSPQNPSARNRIGAGTAKTKTGTGATGGGAAAGGTGGGGTGAGGGGTTTKEPTDALKGLDIEQLKKDYPGYSWVWDLSEKFSDTKKLWADYLNGDITEERFNNLVGQSSWYRDQNTISETRRIKNRFGDILDSGTLSKLVNESIQFNYDDQELDSAFFTSALQRNVITGEFIDGKAAKAALASNKANGYRNYAKSMFLTTDDNEVEKLLTGQMTEEDFDRNIRQVAQATYKNWADLLNDPTMTMESIVKPWKNMAAQVLELDPSQIDMTKPQFSVAYAGSPDGKMGAMSLGDWYVKLRSDSTYGWDKTTQAKQEAQELGYNIAKTFGKV